MRKLNETIDNLNKIILSKTNNRYDLRTFFKYINPLNEHFMGVGENLDMSPYLLFNNFTDPERKLLLELRKFLENQPEGLKQVDQLLQRNILYVGSECERLGDIHINNEFDQLKQIITSSHLSIERVMNTSMNNIIDRWDEVKPEILVFSCHGSPTALYLKDDSGECREVLNSDLTKFFKKRSQYTECVILSSCESLNLGKYLQECGKNVVCINCRVNIQTATDYLHNFFDYINSYSLGYNEVYRNAHERSMEKIYFAGLPDSFAFEFLQANLIF